MNSYLLAQKRFGKWFSTEDATIEYFLSQPQELPDIYLDLQLQYSGYYFSSSKRGDGFSFFLISKSDIEQGKPLRLYKNLLEIQIAHDSAQYHFYINPQGEICTYEDKVVPIWSSVEALIEQYAYNEKIHENQIGNRSFGHYNVPDRSKLCKHLAVSYKKIISCSDKYNTWFDAGKMTIKVSRWLGEEEYYATICCLDQQKIDALTSEWRDLKLINN